MNTNRYTNHTPRPWSFEPAGGHYTALVGSRGTVLTGGGSGYAPIAMFIPNPADVSLIEDAPELLARCIELEEALQVVLRALEEYITEDQRADYDGAGGIWGRAAEDRLRDELAQAREALGISTWKGAG